MRRVIALLMVILNISGSVAALAAPAGDLAGDGAGTDGGGRSREGGCRADIGGDGAGMASAAAGRVAGTAEGLYWNEDRRLTNNTSDDTFPALAFDSNCNGFVSYFRAGNMYFQRVDRNGNALVDEKFVAAGQMPVLRSGQPAERMGVDGHANLHLLWSKEVLTGPMYQKYAADTNPLCQPVNLSSAGNSPSGMGLAAGASNLAYMAYINGNSAAAELEWMDGNFNLATGYHAAYNCRSVTIGLAADGKPYLFMRNDTNGWLMVAAFLSNGSRIMPPTRVVTMAEDPGLPMPALAFGSDGAIHLLYATDAIGTRWLYYLKLAPNGTGLTSDILVTDSSADFGDICVDRDRNVYIAWGNATDDELYFVRIRPGKENDTLNPVRLTNSAGIDRAPQIVADREGSLHLAWSSDRDGNWETYYKHGMVFGAELTMSPEEMARILNLRPNETKTANLTVRNMGALNDTVYLGINADFLGKKGGVGQDYGGEGYKVWLDDVFKKLYMAPNEVRRVPVHVRAPATGNPNEYITVAVDSLSLCRPEKHDIVEFRVYLVIDTRILLGCPQTRHVTAAGVATLYALSLSNPGDVEVGVELNATGPPDWDISLDPVQARLRPGESVDVGLSVTPPLDAAGDSVGVVSVRAVCAGNGAARSEADTFTTVKGETWIALAPDRTAGMVAPGGFADYVLKVERYGNRAGQVGLILETAFEDRGWEVSLDAYSISLSGYMGGFVVLRVAAPAEAAAGDNLTVRVDCFDAERRCEANCSVTTGVLQVRSLRSSVSPFLAYVLPGWRAMFNVNFANSGNGPERFTVGALEAPPGWAVSFFGREGPVAAGQALDVRYGGGAWLDVLVASPANAPAGKVRFDGEVMYGDGARCAYGFTVVVDRLFGLELVADVKPVAGEPQERLEFGLNLTNTGNGADVFRLAAAGLPPGWADVVFLDAAGAVGSEPELASGRTAHMRALVQVPARTPLDRVAFNITATSEGGPNATVGLVLAVRKADLVITGLELLSTGLKAGLPVMVKAEVRNAGEADAANVSISYSRNRVLRTTEALGIIRPGEVRTATFVWVPLVGWNTLEFVADPQDSVCERNETDNRALMLKEIPVEAAEPARGIPWWPALAAVLIILAAVWLVVRKLK